MKKTLLFSALFGLILTALASAQTYNCPMGGYGGMMSGYYGSGSAIFGWIFSLLAAAALILLIVWLVKQLSKK